MNKKVLIVEDSQIVRRGLIELTDWKSLDCEVIGEATDGISGESMVLELKPDIVLVDIMLPGKSGIEMIEALQGKTGAKYIIISAYSEFEYAKKAIQLNVVDYLVKPVSDEQLYDAIKKACGEPAKKEIVHVIDDSGRSYVSMAASFIHKNYQKNITIQVIASEIKISESYLSHIFRDECHITITEYLTRYRINEAVKMLYVPTILINDIAEAVGFADQRYFSSVFKKVTGLSPSEFRKSIQNNK